MSGGLFFGLVVREVAALGATAGELDRANLRILESVNSSGEVLLTHTELGGRVALRLSIGNLKTTLAHVRRAWQLLEDAAAEEARA